jgi:hypothetical protein
MNDDHLVAAAEDRKQVSHRLASAGKLRRGRGGVPGSKQSVAAEGHDRQWSDKGEEGTLSHQLLAISFQLSAKQIHASWIG